MRLQSLFFALACLSASAQSSVPQVSWEDVHDQSAEWYAGEQARRIADNVLLYQRLTGGWPKNVDMARTITPAERQKATADKKQLDSTIDNGATWRQLRYLARVFNATKDARVRDGFVAGLDFLYAAEYARGGWPQIFPLRKDYTRHITFNDGASANVASLLRDIASGDEAFTFVDGHRRTRARQSVERTLEMILAAQIRVDGRLAAWCAQHDADTLEPRPARVYEPASLSGMESVGILQFLIGQRSPDTRVRTAIEAGVEWLRSVRLHGVRLEKVPAPGRAPDFDLRVVSDATAPPLWARFYEIGTNRPMFLGRDGVVHYRLDAIEHERRTGYSWLGPYAAKLLDREYPAWRARVGD